MKSFLPLLSFSLIISSCSTAYKTGQTPDDVYFSPQRPQEEYVRVEDKKEHYYEEDEVNRGDRNRNSDYYSYDDRYLRMKVRNRQRWNDLDNDYYSYNPYVYQNNNNYYYNSPWNSYSYWNYYYNPYARQVIVINPKSPSYNTRPRTMNLRVFDQPGNAVNPNSKSQSSNTGSGNNNSKSRSAPRRDLGNDLRTIFGTGNDNSSSTPRSSVPSSSTPTTNSSSGSSGSSSSGSSDGGSRGSATRGR